MAAASIEDKVFLLTALHTGARVGELFRLTWPDVDLVSGTIRLGTRKTATGGMEYATLPMTPELRQALAEHRKRGPRSMDADQQVAHPAVLKPLAGLAPGQGHGVGDKRRQKADRGAMRAQFPDAGIDGRLAALDVDGRVAVVVAQGVADGPGLWKAHGAGLPVDARDAAVGREHDDTVVEQFQDDFLFADEASQPQLLFHAYSNCE